MKSAITKRRVRGLYSCVALLAWLGLHGCGTDDRKRPTAKPRDAAVGMDVDAGPDADTRDKDGSVGSDKDGSIGPVSDSGADDDAGSGDRDAGNGNGNLGDGGPVLCQASDEANSFSTLVPFSDEGRFAMSIGSVGFGVAYQGMGCDGIHVLPVDSAGEFATPSSFIEDCSSIRDMSLLHVAQGWRMVWIDNSAPEGAELHSMLLRENMSGNIGELRTRLTDNELFESRPVLANVDSKPLLAFIASDQLAGTRRITSLLLDGQAEEQDVLKDTGLRKPISLALSQVGKDRAALAWVEEQGMPGIWMQLTDLTGVPQGNPQQISDLVSSGSTIDLARRDIGEGGALLYSIGIGNVNREVRFRRLGAAGELLADEKKIVSAPLQGRDASFARLGGGYVVAYRALPGGPITESEIRITFISKEGNLQHDSQGNLLSYKIASAGAGGGRVTLRVSNDGQLLIAFIDGSTSGPQLRLIRRRLDCAL